MRKRQISILVLAIIALSMLLTACGGETMTPTPVGETPQLIPPASGEGGESVRGAVGFAPIPPACDATLKYNDAFEDEVIRLTNEERRKNGNLPPYTKSDKLMLSARMHSKDMACNIKGLNHTGSNGSNVGDRITAAGYAFTTWAENIAMGYSTPAAVVAGWMNSPGHRANILSPNPTEIGVGYINEPEGVYWTQNFAKPRDGAPPPVPPAATSTTAPAPPAPAATNTMAPPPPAPEATNTTAPAPPAPEATNTTAPAPAGCAPTTDPAMETEVMNLINAARAERGLNALETPADLTTAARTFISEAACERESNALDPWPAASQAQAQTSRGAAEQAQAWITDGSAENFALGPDYVQMGVGLAKHNGRNYWLLVLVP